MRKVARIISLILAALLVGVGCISAAAQEPASLEGEMIVQDNAALETAEQEAAEQTGEVTAGSEEAEQAAQEADEQEPADQAAEEKEEQLNGIPADIPPQDEEIDDTEDKTEEKPAAEFLDEVGDQEADNTVMEDPFTANVSIELTNTGAVRLGDELQLKAVVDGANRTYEVSWQNRVQPAPSDLDPEWIQVETGETYQLPLTEENAGLEYRVLLTADNHQTVASGEYRLPEPVRNDETPDETNPDINTAPVEEDPQPAEETEKAAGTELLPVNADQGETADQAAEEEEMIVPEAASENTDISDKEESDLDLAWNEIVVVTETAPETAAEPDASDQPAEEPEGADDKTGESQTPIGEGEEPETPDRSDESQLPDESGEGQEAPDRNDESQLPDESGEGQETLETDSEQQEIPAETDTDLQAPPESGEEPAAPAEEEPQKERRIRILSTQGETVVCGETVRMMVDLSDFGDCSELSVIWEADKDGNWEEVGTGENLEYTATADNINWSIRARVRYLP